MNFYDANIEKKYTFKSIQSILYICLNVVTKTPKTINIAQMTISNSTKERQNETNIIQTSVSNFIEEKG